MSDKSPIIIKKIKKGGDSHHGGSWKVALADFMTAMMAFFLVMWVIGLDQDTRALIAGYFRDPLNFMRQQEGSKLDSVLPANPPSHLTEESKTLQCLKSK
jgi:chemotaxis protein MotB